MLTKLMGEDGGVKPVEAEFAAMDHVDQRAEDAGFLARFVAETEMMAAFDQTDGSQAGLVR